MADFLQVAISPLAVYGTLKGMSFAQRYAEKKGK
jgi:hypothetical protein